MPVIYRCSKCGGVIYSFVRAGQDYYGVPSPSELMVRIGGICPNCGRAIEPKVYLENVSITLHR